MHCLRGDNFARRDDDSPQRDSDERGRQETGANHGAARRASSRDAPRGRHRAAPRSFHGAAGPPGIASVTANPAALTRGHASARRADESRAVGFLLTQRLTRVVQVSELAWLASRSLTPPQFPRYFCRAQR